MNMLRLMVDSVYLQLYTSIKANRLVSWEREVGASLYMTMPVVWSLDVIVWRFSDVFGIDSLADLVPGRVLYVLVFGVPIWFAIYQLSRRANKANRPVDRLAVVNYKFGRAWQFVFLAAYFVIPFLGLMWSIFG